MVKIILISFTLSFNTVISAQRFDSLASKAYLFIEQNNTEAFRQTYPHLYPEYVKTQLPAYAKAIAFLKKEDSHKAIQSISSIIEEGYLLDELPDDPQFNTLHRQKEWKGILQKITDNNPQNKVRKELKSIQNIDQGIRALYLDCEAKFNKKDAKCLFIKKEMQYVDDHNISKVLKIIDQYGWLGKNEIGEEGNTTLFLTVQHYKNPEVQSQYLPILEEAVRKGNAEPWQLAFLKDRILMNEGKPQIYGTQVITKEGERAKVYPLQDSENVDALRKEAGMEPLSDYLKSFEKDKDSE